MTRTSSPTQGNRPATPAGVRAFIVTPFHRLARTHAASTMADAMLAAALADSLFFSLPADSARAPVVRYLLITMLPFAVLSPLIGPLIDRLKGGHRFVLIGTAVVRAVLAYLMIDQIAAGGPPFFFLALCVLVSQRAYHVARSARAHGGRLRWRAGRGQLEAGDHQRAVGLHRRHARRAAPARLGAGLGARAGDGHLPDRRRPRSADPQRPRGHGQGG